jgi:hypothetical protein
MIECIINKKYNRDNKNKILNKEIESEYEKFIKEYTVKQNKIKLFDIKKEIFYIFEKNRFIILFLISLLFLLIYLKR